MSGSHSRGKGKRGEREIVSLARAAGLSAERTWQTAQCLDGIERCCDVRIAGTPHQVKRRRGGFSVLYDGLENVAGLFLRSDGREWLVVIRAEDYLKLKLRDAAKDAAKI